ncbi:right-handed parallel beta-helix repeat-containing protein [Paenibacillus luteus]|uniref:right-handed parallel beta-helix repeat-containing protein n=1 Tax=Paenibacillus luteus TaxID=2545753 RepID=UPI0011416D3E|nr:right-handed parallel beta-helix repeat-containing protein [Paenibacillus luteus]
MQSMSKLFILGLTVAAVFILMGQLRTHSTTPVTSIYYVDSRGNDDNAGTKKYPWKTLQHAADVAKPGSTVYVRGGIYKQKLKIIRSGSARSGSITFASFPEETAIIDGSGLTVSEQQGLVEIESASHITIKGFEIRNFIATQNEQMPIGIYVHGSGGYIKLLNNKVHDIKNTAEPIGRELLGRDAHGIAVYGSDAPASLHHVTIDGNELYNLVLGSSESLVLNGNVDTFSVTNNLIHDNDNIGIDLIGFEGIAPYPTYDQVRNGLVSGNRVYNITSNFNPSYGKSLPNHSNAAGGIYIDGGKDSIIERNYSYNNDIGIEIASEHAGKATSDITVRSNIVYSNRYTGIAMGGYDSERGATVNCKIINNTLYQNNSLSDGSGQILLQYDTKNNIIANNIIFADSSNVFIYNEQEKNSGNKIDYNLYYAAGGISKATWIWKNKEYVGFSAYLAGTGNDSHSIFADPKFVDQAKNDFHLKAASPAIDAGSPYSWTINTLDIDGQARPQGESINIGADGI